MEIEDISYELYCGGHRLEAYSTLEGAVYGKTWDEPEGEGSDPSDIDIYRIIVLKEKVTWVE